MTKELWRSVKGHEDHYEVSNLGRVRSIKRNLYLKPQKNNHGYMFVYLSFGEVDKQYVHRLVATAFVQNNNPEINTVVNHIDCNPENNRADNLEWTTHFGNVHHSIEIGRYKRTEQWLSRLRNSNERKSRGVIGTNIADGSEIRFACLNDSIKAGFSPSCVCNCCKGKRATHKGYLWRYAR